VFGEPNILTEILARIGCTRSVARTAAVHSTWSQAVAAPDFVELYISRNAPSLLGFLVQFGGVFGLASQLVDPTPEPEGETAAARRAQIDRPSLEGDNVVGSRGGYVLCESTEQPDGYYVSFLCEEPKTYIYAAPPLQQIARLPNQYSSNSYGQFGILPDAGRGGMAFFALDNEGDIRRTCEGVTLDSQESVYVHVSIFTDGHWGDSKFSEPIQPKGRVVFHPSPYCFLTENILFMIYVVGSVICFDRSKHEFSVLPMPGWLGSEARSEMQYCVGEHSKGGITLAEFRGGLISTWVLITEKGAFHWYLASSIDIMDLFVKNFGPDIWDQFILGNPVSDGDLDFHTVQPRAVSLNGRFLIVTVGFDQGMYIVDTDKSKVTEVDQVDPDSILDNIYTVTEPWPPIF
jgi:hypothetical protein